MATAAARARRDARILALTAEGLSRREVARRVGLSPAGVQNVLVRGLDEPPVLEISAPGPARPPVPARQVASSPSVRSDPAVDPGPGVQQADRPDSYWRSVWQAGGDYGDAEGYKRGFRDAAIRWGIVAPCTSCGKPAHLVAADAAGLGVLELLRSKGWHHAGCP